MNIQYLHLGKMETVKVSPGTLAILQQFAALRVSVSALSDMTVKPDYAQSRTAAKGLESAGFIQKANRPEGHYRLSARGISLVTSARDMILQGIEPQSEHNIVFTYKGVEPHLLITAEAAEVLGYFKPYAPGIETYEPGVKPSPGLRATYAQMVEEGIMINCSIEHESTMFTLTGLGRLVRKAMQDAEQEEKAKPAPDAWRYRFAGAERSERAWSFTDDYDLIQRLGREFEIQPMVIQQ